MKRSFPLLAFFLFAGSLGACEKNNNCPTMDEDHCDANEYCSIVFGRPACDESAELTFQACEYETEIGCDSTPIYGMFGGKCVVITSCTATVSTPCDPQCPTGS